MDFDNAVFYGSVSFLNDEGKKEEIRVTQEEKKNIQTLLENKSFTKKIKVIFPDEEEELIYTIVNYHYDNIASDLFGLSRFSSQLNEKEVSAFVRKVVTEEGEIELSLMIPYFSMDYLHFKESESKTFDPSSDKEAKKARSYYLSLQKKIAKWQEKEIKRIKKLNENVSFEKDFRKKQQFAEALIESFQESEVSYQKKKEKIEEDLGKKSKRWNKTVQGLQRR